MSPSLRRGRCGVCHLRPRLRKNGQIMQHQVREPVTGFLRRCAGSESLPSEPETFPELPPRPRMPSVCPNCKEGAVGGSPDAWVCVKCGWTGKSARAKEGKLYGMPRRRRRRRVLG